MSSAMMTMGKQMQPLDRPTATTSDTQLYRKCHAKSPDSGMADPAMQTLKVQRLLRFDKKSHFKNVDDRLSTFCRSLSYTDYSHTGKSHSY